MSISSPQMAPIVPLMVFTIPENTLSIVPLMLFAASPIRPKLSARALFSTMDCFAPLVTVS